jgi:hypothetical protein
VVYPKPAPFPALEAVAEAILAARGMQAMA